MMLFFEIFVNFWKFLKSFPHNIWSSRVINVCDFCYQWLVSVLMLWIPFTVCHSVSDSIIQQHINQPTSESVPTTKALIRQWSQRFKDIHVLPSNDRSVVQRDSLTTLKWKVSDSKTFTYYPQMTGQWFEEIHLLPSNDRSVIQRHSLTNLKWQVSGSSSKRFTYYPQMIGQWFKFKEIHLLPSNDRSVVCPGKCGFCVVPSSSCCTAWNALFSLSAFFLSSVISWLPWRSSLQFFSSVVRQFTIYKC